MGRKKHVSRARAPHNYPSTHLYALPYEILLLLFSAFAEDKETLLRLLLVCSKFNHIINKNFLYSLLEFKSFDQIEKFSQFHLPYKSLAKSIFKMSNESSTKVNYITSVHFVNPPVLDSSNHKVNIVGSYNVESVQRKNIRIAYETFVDLFRLLLNDAYGLKYITFSEVSPKFSFPDDSFTGHSSTADSSFFRGPRPSRSLSRLVLKGQSGWSIPFKISHISAELNAFDTISELALHNFVINDSKLNSFILPKKHTPICIKALCLTSCIFMDTNHKKQPLPHTAKKCSELFTRVSSLSLLNIQSSHDLSMIDYVKLNNSLSCLTLDLKSSIFYNTTNETVFNFVKYNNFFKLVCSGTGGYSKLKKLTLLNFDLFDSNGHIHNVEEDLEPTDDAGSWIEQPSDRFSVFLANLSRISELTIVLIERPQQVHSCVKCGFIEKSKEKRSTTASEWAKLLNPLLTGNEICKLRILDHKLMPIFTRI